MNKLDAHQKESICRYIEKNPDTDFIDLAAYFSQLFGVQLTGVEVRKIYIDKHLR